MNPIDTYRDTFLKFLSDGMTHLEAYSQFCPVALNRAVAEEITSDAVQMHMGKLITPTGQVSLLELCSTALREADDEQTFEEQCIPLMLAGWTSEVPECYQNNSRDKWSQCPQMSLYWRSPSKRPGKPGRKYLSTNQAFNAMQRAK